MNVNFSNKTYDALKWITLVLLPAFSTFYLAMANVWNLPYAPQVVGTIAALDVFLAALLGISTSNYKAKNAGALAWNSTQAIAMNSGQGWVLSKSTYELLTWVAQIFLPGLATLYFGLSQIWGLPYGDQVAATIMTIDTFLGLLLGFTSAQFLKQVALACVDPDPVGGKV